MNVVDALVITLGLDTSNYTAEQKKAMEALKKFSEESDKRSKEVADSGKKAAGFFSGLKIEILGALAAFGSIAGMKDFIQANVESQASLGRLSANIDMTAKKIEQFRLVARQSGAKSDDADSLLQSITSDIVKAQIGVANKLVPLSLRFGFDVRDKDGKFLSPEQIAYNISDRMRQLTRPQATYMAAEGGLGSSFNFLDPANGKSLKENVSSVADLVSVTKESTEAAEQLQSQWVALEQRFSQTGTTGSKIFAQLEPVLQRLGTRFANWLDSIDWDKVIAQITTFIGKINDLVQAMGGWKTIAEVLIGLIGVKLAASILGPIASITRLLPWLSAGAAGFTSMGAAAMAAGTAMLALVAASALHVDPLGGKSRDDGTHEDEPSAAMANKPVGTDRQSLWNRILHKPTSYKGSEQQAAALLAGYMDVGQMDDRALKQAQFDILSGHIRPGITAGYADPSFDASTHAAAASGQYSSTTSRSYASNDALFAALQQKTGVSAQVLKNMFATESSSGTNLLSKKGAMGPMGFMPATAKEYGLNDKSVEDLDLSATAAATKMQHLLTLFHGNYAMAVAAYNEGEGNLAKTGLGGAPKETQDYVRKVAGIQVGPAASGQVPGGRQNTSTSTAEVHIDTINVNAPKATDAPGIAQAMSAALKGNGLIASATTGIQ